MHSPVWIDYDSDKEAGETFTDLEYYSDDYYDHAPEAAPRKCANEEKAKLSAGKKRKSSSQAREKTKRRRVDHTQAVSELSSAEPVDSSLTETSSSSAVVRWLKNSTFAAPPLPLLADDEGEKVALLKDWRDRFKIRRRDDVKELETKSQDYEVPVMKESLIFNRRGDQGDSMKAVYDNPATSATGVEVEQYHTDSKSHTNPDATLDEDPAISDGVVSGEPTLRPTVPRKATMTVNGTKSRRRHAEVDDEPETRETERKAVTTPTTQPNNRSASSLHKPVSRKRKGDDPPKPAAQTGTALRSQEAL